MRMVAKKMPSSNEASSPPACPNDPGADRNYTSELAKVVRAEEADVLARRTAQGGGPVSPEKVRTSLVGLALSGGGVRSASFNLGLLQALFRHGLLKHVDYLSTVSGGGYVGGYLASLAQRKELTVTKNDPTIREQLVATPAEPDRVVRFVRNGKYLYHPRAFFNQHLIGVIWNNLAMLSGLALVCMTVAYLWRVLDSNEVVAFLYTSPLPVAELWTELWRPFLPGVLLLLAWLVAWFAVYGIALVRGRRPKTGLTRWLLIASVVCLLIGLAVVLATPVISIPQTKSDDNENQSVIEVSHWQRLAANSILGVVLAALLPFFRPQRLLRLGIHPKSIWERRLFLLATSAMFAGIPFVLIWWFAHHDFAGRDLEKRDTVLRAGDFNFRTWNSFWERVSREAGADGKEHSPSLGGFLRHQGLPGKSPLAEIFDVRPYRWETYDGGKSLRQLLSELPIPVDADLSAKKEEIAAFLTNQVIENPEFARYLFRPARRGSSTESGLAAERRKRLEAQIQHHGEAPRLHELVLRLEDDRLTTQEGKELNRLLLEALYPGEILPRAKVYRQNVIDEDQAARRSWMGWLLLAFVLFGFVNLNATSLHSYYRDQLAETFLEPIANRDRTIRLSELDTTRSGAPYLLISATVNRLPGDRDPSLLTRSVPEGPTPAEELSNRPVAVSEAPCKRESLGETPTESFLLSRHYCGAPGLGYRQTAAFMNDRLELDDALAISGAAFSPVQTGNPLIGFLMTIFNLRLGQWVHNPARRPGPAWNDLQWIPTAHAILWGSVSEWLFGATSRAWHFLTDGGHHENLGVWPLLERRCKLIIVSDASQDGVSAFSDLLRVVRRARFERGILILGMHVPAGELPGAGYQPGEALALLRPTRPLPFSGKLGESGGEEAKSGGAPCLRLSARHFFLAQIVYPDTAERGYLIYLKPTITGDEPVELLAYAAMNADFPHNPTLDQLYDEDRFESYRQLGEHIGDALCREFVTAGKPPSLWDWPLASTELLQCTGVSSAQEAFLHVPEEGLRPTYVTPDVLPAEAE
jgi:predicted acylesterase/phospholipase RssA